MQLIRQRAVQRGYIELKHAIRACLRMCDRPAVASLAGPSDPIRNVLHNGCQPFLVFGALPPKQVRRHIRLMICYAQAEDHFQLDLLWC